MIYILLVNTKVFLKHPLICKYVNLQPYWFNVQIPYSVKLQNHIIFSYIFTSRPILKFYKYNFLKSALPIVTAF